MLRFVESESDLNFFYDVIGHEDIILFPIFDNENRKYQSKLSFVYIISLKTASKILINRSHIDALKIDLYELLHTTHFKNKVFVYGLKWVRELVRGDYVYDLQMVDYYINNQVDALEHLYYNKFVSVYEKLTDDIWSVIPILKQVEVIDTYAGKMIKILSDFEITDSFKRFNLATTYIYNELEKPGVMTSEGMEYCNYQPYTSTSRPSNTNGKYNFLALNKRSGVRKKFISRHPGGLLVQFDYSAYHFRLIANLIDYIFPSDVNIHEYIASKILNKSKITKKEYEKIKSDNFSVLYGKNITPPDIEFFNRLTIYKSKLFSEFEKNGFVNTIIFNRPITKENNEDMAEHKLFNYIIQSYETERNLSVIYRILELLSDKETKLILYNYDGFVFDLNRKEEDLIPQIKKILEDGDYPVTIEYGTNYNDLVEYTGTVDGF